ncbi:MAG: hypothetical protein IKR81_03765 [Victivallales bacterium]|nr:hypothetical protein [Victivallales bacterium]
MKLLFEYGANINASGLQGSSWRRSHPMRFAAWSWHQAQKGLLKQPLLCRCNHPTPPLGMDFIYPGF